MHESKESNLLKASQIASLNETIETCRCDELESDKVVYANFAKIRTIEEDLNTYEIFSKKSELTISTLQADNVQLHAKLIELSSEINAINIELETCKLELSTENSRLTDIAEHFKVVVVANNGEVLEKIKEKLIEFSSESQIIKINEEFMSSKVVECESENKSGTEMNHSLKNLSEKSKETLNSGSSYEPS